MQSNQVELSSVRALIGRLPNDNTIGSPAMQARGAFNAAEAELSKLVDIQLGKDNTTSEITQRGRVKDALKAAADRSTKAIEGLKASQLAQQEQAAGLVEDKQAAEVRNVFRTLDDVEKRKFIQQATDNRDKAVMAALTNPATSPLLVGLSAEQMMKYRTDYLDKVLPINTEYLDSIEANSQAIVNVLSRI